MYFLSSLYFFFSYLGRKHMSRTKEYLVKGATKLVWARYSYWTLGYVLRLSGAKKLLAGEPLGKMVPVDEYIPIMFDDHSEYVFVQLFSLLVLTATRDTIKRAG